MNYIQKQNIIKSELPIGSQFSTQSGSCWQVAEFRDTCLIANAVKTGNPFKLSYEEMYEYLQNGLFRKGGTQWK